MTEGRKGDRPLVGLTAMLIGVFGTSVTDAMAKHLVNHYPIGQIMVLRGALVMLLAWPLVARAGGWRTLRTTRVRDHLLRALAALCATVTFYLALRELPLATTVAISLSAPIMMTALSVPLLGERVGVWRWSAVLVGFSGVLIITDPFAAGGLSIGAIWALLCGLAFALSMIGVRWLGSSEGSLVILYWLNAAMLAAGLVQLPFVAMPMGGFDVAMLAVMAAGMLAGQLLTINAFRLAPVSLVSPIYYLGLVYTGIIGWLVWAENPPVQVWVGSAVVIASGLVISWRERVRARSP
jgi:drug/metabolite transporter (DMT)-like permease